MSIAERPEIRISDTPERAARDCAEFVLALLSEAVQANGQATLAISGGSTPKLLFADMAQRAFDWSDVHIFWVDERCVPPDNDQSNFKMANETLLMPARIAQANIHRIYGELSPSEGGQRYLREVKNFFHLADGDLPVFDVIHRGMGNDAHTASLFPGSPLVYEDRGIATDVWVEKMSMYRITMLPGALKAAKQTVLQVAGKDKAEALEHVLDAPEDITKYPCQIASRDRHAAWFLDKAAAAKV